MLWEIDIHPADGAGRTDRAAERVAAAARELGLADNLQVATARGYLVQGDIAGPAGRSSGWRTSCWPMSVVERAVIGRVGVERQGDAETRRHGGYLRHGAAEAGRDGSGGTERAGGRGRFGHSAGSGGDASQVLARRRERRGDQSASASRLLGERCDRASVFRPARSWSGSNWAGRIGSSCGRWRFASWTMTRSMRLSREGQLYLQLAEMQTIRQHFRELGRDPTDVELETIAQTWSEHCSHKTLAGRIAYRDEHGERQFENMLKETIFAATQKIRERLGADDWCVSVFEDNAGVVRFDDEFNLAFKVETHNHPSALEPYGGANTGVGGVIRDIMGTGLGAKPICSTDVFCFAPPDVEARAESQGRRQTDCLLIAARRASSAAGDAGRRRGRARLRQPDGNSDGERGRVFRRAVSGQSARVLRQRRACCRATSRTSGPSRAI